MTCGISAFITHTSHGAKIEHHMAEAEVQLGKRQAEAVEHGGRFGHVAEGLVEDML